MPSRPARSQPPAGYDDRDLPPPPSESNRPGLAPTQGAAHPGVSFQDSVHPQRGQSSSSQPYPARGYSDNKSTGKGAPSAYNNHTLDHAGDSTEGLPYGFAPPGDGQGGGADFRRKKSLVRPDRERVDPGDRLFHYRQHAQQMEESGTGRVGVIPSATGNVPNHPSRAPLRRGKSILAREEDQAQESGLSLFKRGNTLRRKTTNGEGINRATRASRKKDKEMEKLPEDRGFWGGIAPGPVDGWMIYCYLLTFLVPGFVLRGVFGKRTREAQRAWREKMGLVFLILCLMGAVGFLTFGFTKTVCGKPPNRTLAGTIEQGTLIINGYTYDLGKWNHPAAGTTFDGKTNPLFTDEFNAGGKDASFLFQKTNENCLDVITPATGSGIVNEKGKMEWYFPCNLRDQNGSPPNITGITSKFQCHTSNAARTAYYDLPKDHNKGQVYYDWSNVTNKDRNLAVYKSAVLDLDLLQWLQTSQTNYPVIFDYMKNKNASYQSLDLSMFAARSGLSKQMDCLADITTVGFISTKTIGCVASDVVLYVSLVFIIGVVSAKFAMAVAFGWFLSWRLGSFKGESYAQRMARSAAIESWTDDIYRPAPSRYRPNVASGKGAKNRGTVFLPTTSRFSKADSMMVTSSRPSTTYGAAGGGFGRSSTASTYGTKGLLSASPLGGDHNTPPGSPGLHGSRSSNSLPFARDDSSRNSLADPSISQCPFPLHNVIPQPPADYEPFNFPLIQNILLVTAYSESIEGLRTTIDSLATTDYPNSHKVILVIADGMVRGSGSKLRTPDIVLGMMKELVIPAEEVEAHSYVAIADGHKRHNMAKVYAGFYDYDDDTVELSKQQRVPIVLVAKVGNPLEAHDAKPGNRGKRDSQIVLMAFLQKVMFDERMTTFEYEFFNSLWRVTGVSPDRYEGVLCVDADTKVFPDSLTRMSAAMHNDPDIMGLCGETKIANKSETWVTMIQVFEYYISHHQTKAFEAVFGGVTCLPGCFSMYRIKAPKGESGYWVPILANPDVVEHYSENVVDTLHKKNLLLLGEDRYLSTLMLKTFPKRKMVFIPQAVCKTVVPDTFRILLSQRRRWINSTIHNLFELLFVRDLCGTFCFSMQFVVFMELVGTLVLPAAIAFTIYLIVVACIPSQPTPTIPLILLAIILGLPGLLIVITSRKIAYVGWMLIYLFSLPIWNFVLPAYSYWRFDDFSWGETRKIEGDAAKEETGHGDKDGVFDSSSIVMKRWAEFERERRWKSGTQSRDSYYDVVQRSSSPRRENRYSMASTAETHFGGSSEGPIFGGGRPSQSFNSTTQSSYGPNFNPSAMPGRMDSAPLLELPAPLGPRTGSTATDLTDDDDYRQHMERSTSSNESGPFQDRYGQSQQRYANSGDDHSPDPNAFSDDGHAGSSSRLSHQAGSGGVSLVDNGFLPPQQSQERVRRVARNAQRRTSGSMNTSPVAVSSRPGPSSPVSSRQSQGPPQNYQNSGSAPGGYARFDRSGQ